MDATVGHKLLSFLEAYLGYNQILMYPINEPKTTCITPYNMHCYKVMPFGLKNVGATYQCIMSQVFEPLLGRIVEVYIDDILVKSRSRKDHLAHLREPFCLLQEHQLRLNPAKCTFKVSSRNFLGFPVCQIGIEMALGQVPLASSAPYRLWQGRGKIG